MLLCEARERRSRVSRWVKERCKTVRQQSALKATYPSCSLRVLVTAVYFLCWGFMDMALLTLVHTCTITLALCCCTYYHALRITSVSLYAQRYQIIRSSSLVLNTRREAGSTFGGAVVASLGSGLVVVFGGVDHVRPLAYRHASRQLNVSPAHLSGCADHPPDVLRPRVAALYLQFHHPPLSCDCYGGHCRT
jgi:hypothetical protein